MGGSVEWEEISQIYSKYPAYADLIKLFVESGTYKGVTTRMASKHFDRVITFEIVKALHEESIESGKKEGCNNILYILGDSVSALAHLMPTLIEPTVYFIDAHISGADSSYNGKELVPLMSELDVILTHNKGPNIFILDDARFWTGDVKPDDWAHISIDSVLELFKTHGVTIKDHFLRNDRYWIIV